MWTLYLILSTLLEFYMYAIIIYLFMSWFPNARETTFGQILGRIVEPYLSPFRRIIPSIGMIDVSPIVALIAIRFADSGLRSIFEMLV